MKFTFSAIATCGALLLASTVSAAPASAAFPEFSPGVAGEVFNGTSKKVKYQVKAGAAIECTKGQVTKGELLNAKAALVVWEMSGCKSLGFAANSEGSAAGLIVMHLEAELCYLEKANKKVGIVLLLLPVTVEVPVAAQSVALEGSYVAEITPVAMKTAVFTLVSQQAAGVQGIEKCEGDPARTIKASENGGAQKKTGVEVAGHTITFIKERTLEA